MYLNNSLENFYSFYGVSNDVIHSGDCTGSCSGCKGVC